MFRKGVIIVFLLCLLTAGLATALNAQEALVSARVDKNKILIGEPVLLTLEIRAPGGSTIQPFRVDSIPHFEFLKKDSIVKEEIGGALVIRQYFRITSFDSGRWVIPPIALRSNIRTPTILMDVVYTDPFDPNQPYHDIQDIRSVPFKLSKTFEKWWYLAALLLIIITLVVYWLTAEKKPKEEARIYKGAYSRAKQQLKELKEARLPENQFYARLVEILRNYLSDRAKVNSLKQTSNDLVAKIQPLFKDETLYRSLSQVMSLCDLVKFAKYDPEDVEAQSAYEVVERSVDHIEDSVKAAAAAQQAAARARAQPVEIKKQ